MIDKSNTSFTISDDNIPAILRVSGEGKDPNFQDVPPRDRPKYWCERYWIEQWSPTKRWKNRGFVSCGGWTWLRHADLGRKLDDPGDAFFDLFLSTSNPLYGFAPGSKLHKPSYSTKSRKDENVYSRVQ